MSFSDEIKMWRARSGITQDEASKLLCVSARTLQGWERGRYQPGTVGPIRKLIEMLESVRDDKSR